MDPTNGRVAFVVSSDSSERFPLRSALNHGATNVPPDVLPLKAVFVGIADAEAESESRKNGDSLDESPVAAASRRG